jgi:hypothetical protein
MKLIAENLDNQPKNQILRECNITKIIGDVGEEQYKIVADINGITLTSNMVFSAEQVAKVLDLNVGEFSKLFKKHLK